MFKGLIAILLFGLLGSAQLSFAAPGTAKEAAVQIPIYCALTTMLAVEGPGRAGTFGKCNHPGGLGFVIIPTVKIIR